jgi:hypothetical protein
MKVTGKNLLKGKVEEHPGIGSLPTLVDAQARSVDVSALSAGVNVGDHLVVSSSGTGKPHVSGSHGPVISGVDSFGVL